LIFGKGEFGHKPKQKGQKEKKTKKNWGAALILAATGNMSHKGKDDNMRETSKLGKTGNRKVVGVLNRQLRKMEKTRTVIGTGPTLWGADAGNIKAKRPGSRGPDAIKKVQGYQESIKRKRNDRREAKKDQIGCVTKGEQNSRGFKGDKKRTRATRPMAHDHTPRSGG